MANILLVDDEDFIRDLYKRQLELEGLPTDAVATGAEALSAIAKNAYNLILLDIMLPDINGIEILRKLKQDEKTKTVPVMLLTNLGQDSIIKEGLNLGAEDYLLKAAYNPYQVVEKIKALLEHRTT